MSIAPFTFFVLHCTYTQYLGAMMFVLDHGAVKPAVFGKGPVLMFLGSI